MARQHLPFALALPPKAPGTTSTRWLYDALREGILDGRLPPGTRLPATRDLASKYGLSRGTVVNAFAMLESEGYVRGHVGSGTFVAGELPDRLLMTRATAATRSLTRKASPRRYSAFASQLVPFGGLERVALRAFRRYLPAVDLFPTGLWAQIASRCIRNATVQQLSGCNALGYQPLREAIAGYLATSRGVRCSADQVVVVSGVQEALDIAARLFLDRGDRAAMEDPGYSGARVVFDAHGASIEAIPIDEEGIVVAPERLRGVRLVYVTPAHQYPVGVTMSLARRLELLAWARSSGALIFEDDYDSEYRYHGRPMPAMQGLEPDSPVLFAGSFSKVLFPSIRLGYLVVPDEIISRIEMALAITSRHAPLLDQAILAEFIDDGHFGRHVRRMREVYAQRIGVLLDYGREMLDGLLDISPIEAGLQTVGWLPRGVSAESAVRAAAARKVDIGPVEYIVPRSERREGIQLGFAAIDECEVRRGVRELAAALGELRGRRTGRSS